MSVPAALRFTYKDYLLLPEDRRYEVIDGDLFMTPAPGTTHQRISRDIEVALHAHVKERGLGEILHAPCDVVLSETDVVQPDILYVSAARRFLVTESHIAGAPDLVIEILSPSTAERDRTAKAKLYARAGVRELWIVDPGEKSIEVLTGEPDGFRRAGLYRGGQTAQSPLLPGLRIPLEEIFETTA